MFDGAALVGCCTNGMMRRLFFASSQTHTLTHLPHRHTIFCVLSKLFPQTVEFGLPNIPPNQIYKWHKNRAASDALYARNNWIAFDSTEIIIIWTKILGFQWTIGHSIGSMLYLPWFKRAWETSHTNTRTHQMRWNGQWAGRWIVAK